MVNIAQLLEYIPPADLSYEEWTEVGMALKQEGLPCSVWDEWSMDDPRYHPGECEKKWESFNGSGVTAGTIVHMAKARGWNPEEGHALDWNSEILYDFDDLKIVDKSWLERSDTKMPADWDPTKDLVKYLDTLFEPDENVGYVMQSINRDGKHIPLNKGAYDRTAGELIEQLRKSDIRSVFGDYNEAGGAWIRFNPLDGAGVKNENVTDFRYALVESDSTDTKTQEAIIRELELPVAAMVHSGGKSVHAIVRVDAIDYAEYRQRVEYIYEVCRKNGLEVDSQNKNPSRLSRMPGITRGKKQQWLMATNIGKSNFAEWKDWIESVNDNLPDFKKLSEVWGDLPDLAPQLIDGILRQGHKMLLSGPSKAGKSFALIQLVIAIAEGSYWLNFKCTQGRVLYVNLELDETSCFHRFEDVYKALGIKPEGINNIDIWNLRGESIPMHKLTPKLIRRAQKEDYIAVIIDPIYKVIAGDENKAGDMAAFCNQFDKLCKTLGCAVIYCHHHSKGSQGAKKAMDRASGSGVFARDPDALLDMIELETEGEDKIPEGCTAWRISSVLREFGPMAPFEVIFEYPVHKITALENAVEVAASPEDLNKKRMTEKEKRVKSLIDYVYNFTEYRNGKGGKYPLVSECAKHLDVGQKAVYNYIKENPKKLTVSDGVVKPARKSSQTENDVDDTVVDRS